MKFREKLQTIIDQGLDGLNVPFPFSEEELKVLADHGIDLDKTEVCDVHMSRKQAELWTSEYDHGHLNEDWIYANYSVEDNAKCTPEDLDILTDHISSDIIQSSEDEIRSLGLSAPVTQQILDDKEYYEGIEAQVNAALDTFNKIERLILELKHKEEAA